MERTGIVTFKGGPMTLLGEEIKVGDMAPDFTSRDNALEIVRLSDFKGKVVVISSVPSLDTPVCETQTKKFNESAAGLDAKVLTISVDLPFAQKRFCSAFKIENVVTVSDYRDRIFGTTYGLLIKELLLLTRAVIVVDKEGKIVYFQIVPEITDEPDYAAALEAVKQAS